MTCEYCGHSVAASGLASKDHRTPVSRGGSNGIENLALSCIRCNLLKATLTESEFRECDKPETLPPPTPRQRKRGAA
jgi:5-methylcytosine-specific restriction endonuclease McrA